MQVYTYVQFHICTTYRFGSLGRGEKKKNQEFYDNSTHSIAVCGSHSTVRTEKQYN